MDGRKEKDYDGAAAGAASTADRAVVIKRKYVLGERPQKFR